MRIISEHQDYNRRLRCLTTTRIMRNDTTGILVEQIEMRHVPDLKELRFLPRRASAPV